MTAALSTRFFRAPGRVNLIGDHTDYNDGLVLPIAIEQATVVAATPRADRRLRVRAENLGEEAEVDLDLPWSGTTGTWIVYVEGMARTLLARGASLRGADLRLRSDLPIGAGLSSSAALEIGVGLALLALAGVSLDPLDLALAAQEAEHRYAGTRCGIMDPLAILLGRQGSALLLDCRTLRTRHVPLDLGEHEIVLADSRVRHANASSGYNDRRAECERAVALLAAHRPGLATLRDLGEEDLPALSRLLPEPLPRRVRHVVTENARTARAAQALAAGDLSRVGALMVESHLSLRDDYAVSSPELDLLVDLAREGGAIGARMTGGGFGGSVVALVRRSDLAGYRARVTRGFLGRFGVEPALRVVQASEGAREIHENGDTPVSPGKSSGRLGTTTS